MSHKNKVGYVTQNATFEIDGKFIVAKINGEVVDRVFSAFNECDHFGYDHRSSVATWLDAFNDGRLDVNGYGLISAHIA